MTGSQVNNLKRVVIGCLHIGHVDNVALQSLQVFNTKTNVSYYLVYFVFAESQERFSEWESFTNQNRTEKNSIDISYILTAFWCFL